LRSKGVTDEWFSHHRPAIDQLVDDVTGRLALIRLSSAGRSAQHRESNTVNPSPASVRILPNKNELGSKV